MGNTLVLLLPVWLAIYICMDIGYVLGISSAGMR